MQQPEGKLKRRMRDGFYSVCGDGRSKSKNAMMICLEAAHGQSTGLPDRLFLAWGRAAWTEVKVGSYRPDMRQCVQMGRLAGAGQRVLVIRGDDVRETLEVSEIEASVARPAEIREAKPDAVFCYRELKSRAFWTYILTGVLGSS